MSNLFSYSIADQSENSNEILIQSMYIVYKNMTSGRFFKDSKSKAVNDCVEIN